MSRTLSCPKCHHPLVDVGADGDELVQAPDALSLNPRDVAAQLALWAAGYDGDPQGKNKERAAGLRQAADYVAGLDPSIENPRKKTKLPPKGNGVSQTDMLAHGEGARVHVKPPKPKLVAGGVEALPPADPPPSSSPRPPPGLNKTEAAILTVLAQSDVPLLPVEVAFRACLRVTGTFNTALAALKDVGKVESAGGRCTITPEGRESLGIVGALPRKDALLDRWYQALKGTERRILYIFYENRHIGPMSPHTVAELCGLKQTGTFNGAFAKVKRLGLVAGKNGNYRLSDAFKRALA